ncbi:MAG: uridine kinase [Natronomonas sp.]|jgi:uridine kinase|uniref:uridine kinase n=1 Tax=Natronomonas sp. TaxID=2184060 RepID=UPI00398A41F2
MFIGIAGGSGAGKTTVASRITEGVSDVRVLPLDNYYRDRSMLSPEERVRVNYDHPDAFDWPLVRDHLDALEDGEAIEMPQYDFENHVRTDETIDVQPGSVIVIEGILALYDDAVRERLGLQLYVETDADVRVLRRIRRDVEERDRDLSGVIDQYLSTVKPMHERFVRPTKRHADLIVPEGANDTAVELLRERIQAAV